LKPLPIHLVRHLESELKLLGPKVKMIDPDRFLTEIAEEAP
jgi:hypothetical protein